MRASQPTGAGAASSAPTLTMSVNVSAQPARSTRSGSSPTSRPRCAAADLPADAACAWRSRESTVISRPERARVALDELAPSRRARRDRRLRHRLRVADRPAVLRRRHAEDRPLVHRHDARAATARARSSAASWRSPTTSACTSSPRASSIPSSWRCCARSAASIGQGYLFARPMRRPTTLEPAIVAWDAGRLAGDALAPRAVGLAAAHRLIGPARPGGARRSPKRRSRAPILRPRSISSAPRAAVGSPASLARHAGGDST